MGKSFEIKLANGKTGEFDRGSDLSLFYERNTKPVGKKRKKKKTSSQTKES